MDPIPDALLLILAWAGFLTGTLFFRGRVLSGPWWFLLRSFLPNWRFYHQVGALPVMRVRTLSLDGHWSEWHGDVPRAQRSIVHWVHNAANNRLLLDQSLVEHLYADLREAVDSEALSRCVSYRLACELARRRALSLSPNAHAVQFELRLIPAFGEASADTTVLSSPALSLQSFERAAIEPRTGSNGTPPGA
jgi:hypothetical protein